MALPSGSIFEVRTTGSDSLNGGHFDAGNGSMATDLAATVATSSAPVVTSASYTFVSGDIGYHLFVKSGTNWISGWYEIASVAGGAATLLAAFGSATTYRPFGVSEITGVATVASPTGGTWAIDYSQSATPLSLTGLTTAAADATILTASATKAMVGNGLFITGGTNFTTGVYSILSVTAGVSMVVDRTCTSAAGAAGTAGLGGCFATPGFASGQAIAQNSVFGKTGTYDCSSTADVAAGRVLTKSAQRWEAYSVVRGDRAAKATLQSTSNSMTVFTTAGSGLNRIVGIEAKLGGVTTTIRGFDFGAPTLALGCKATGCTNVGFRDAGIAAIKLLCEADACNIGFQDNSNTGFTYKWCTAKDCTTYGFDVVNGNATTLDSCITDGCATGIRTDEKAVVTNCTTNGGTNGCIAVSNSIYINHLASNNTTGFSISATMGASTAGGAVMIKCAGYNNTANVGGAGGPALNEGFITLTADPFTNAAGGDFSLNNTAGGGAALRAAGYPSSFPGLSTLTYPNVGAQIPEPATAGALMRAAGTQGGCNS